MSRRIVICRPSEAERPFDKDAFGRPLVTRRSWIARLLFRAA